MRLHVNNRFVLIAAGCFVGLVNSPAIGQIEFAKSTLRVTSATQPATARGTVQQAYGVEQESQQVAQQPELQPADGGANVSPLQAPPRYAARRADYAAPRNAPGLVHAPNMRRAPSMVNVYSSTSAHATLSKMPRPAPVQSRPAAQRTQPRGKPFQFVNTDPAVSPYLNMFRNNATSDQFSNYITNVRPELQRIEMNRQQTAELQKLRGQLQNLSGGAPTSSMPARCALYGYGAVLSHDEAVGRRERVWCAFRRNAPT